MMTIGEKVRLIRKAKGISQKKLAEKAGVGINTILFFENDKTSPSIRTVELMLKAMGCRLEVVKDD